MSRAIGSARPGAGSATLPRHSLRELKIPLVLLPFVGLGIAGTWWWGGSSRTEPVLPEPLRPPVASPAIPAVASEPIAPIDEAAATRIEKEEREPMVPGPSEDCAKPASSLTGRDGGSRPPSFDKQVVDKVVGLYSERLHDTGLELVQRIENGQAQFTLEAREEELPSDGPITTKHSTGTKASEGTLRNGKRVGSWCEWYAEGQKSAQGNYFHGTKHGFWTYWYENGQVREAGEYLYGRKEGLWTSWYDNGQKERIAYYCNDRAEDRTTIWYSDGTKAAEGQLEEDLREGLWLEWHENAALGSRGTYRHGRAEGRWEYWDADGALDLGQSGVYQDGRRISE